MVLCQKVRLHEVVRISTDGGCAAKKLIVELNLLRANHATPVSLGLCPGLAVRQRLLDVLPKETWANIGAYLSVPAKPEVDYLRRRPPMCRASTHATTEATSLISIGPGMFI